MILVGLLCAVGFWLLSALVLTDYEVHVRVLSPRGRAMFGAVAFAAGLVLWALMSGWRP